MGMRLNRSLAIRDRGITALADCYSASKSFGLTSAAMGNRRRETLERLGVYKAPHWVLSYLDGYWRAKIDAAYRYDLVFGAIIDGVFYSTHSDRDDYYEKNGFTAREWSDMGGWIGTRGHYWKKTLKPFFIDSPAELKAA